MRQDIKELFELIDDGVEADIKEVTEWVQSMCYCSVFVFFFITAPLWLLLWRAVKARQQSKTKKCFEQDMADVKARGQLQELLASFGTRKRRKDD